MVIDYRDNRQSSGRKVAAVLIVDDDYGAALRKAGTLLRNGFRAAAVYDCEKASEAMDACHFDVMIVAIHLPCAEGVRMLARLRAAPAAPRIIVTARPEQREDLRFAATLFEADAVLEKPVDEELLVATVRRCLTFREPIEGSDR